MTDEKTPEELLEVRLGLSTQKDLIERLHGHALILDGSMERMQRLEDAKRALDRLEERALEKYFAEVQVP